MDGAPVMYIVHLFIRMVEIACLLACLPCLPRYLSYMIGRVCVCVCVSLLYTCLCRLLLLRERKKKK